MKDVKTLVTAILKSPELARSFAGDTKALAKVAEKIAGAAGGELKLAGQLGSAVSALLRQAVHSSSAVAGSPPSGKAVYLPTTPGRRSNGPAVAGIVALVAATGTVAVLGVVSAAALGRTRRTPAS
jgi:hypothetical protein